MKDLIFGTTNPAKIMQIQGALKLLKINVIGLPEFARQISVVEDGETAQINARKKALAYSAAIKQPVLSMDNALFLDGLSSDMQPGIHVRRIGNGKERPSDDELLAYYSKLISHLGERISGRWEYALCYARPDGTSEETTIKSSRVFVSKPSLKTVAGYPLESLQIDMESGKYISEMTQVEQDEFWQRSIGKKLADFVKSLNYPLSQ